MKNHFASIELADLSAVTGGVTASGASTTDQNAAMLQMVTQLQSSIQTLAQSQQQDPMAQMMPMMMMMGMKH